MMPLLAEHIVSNTGPLISLEKLTDGFIFIRKLYTKILIPQKVLEEVSVKNFASTGEYLAYYGINDLIEVRLITINNSLRKAGNIYMMGRYRRY